MVGGKFKNGSRFLVLATGWKVMPFKKLVPGLKLMFPVKFEAWRWKDQKFKNLEGRGQNLLNKR